MNFYTIYIEDDRYRVPTLLTAEFPDDSHAAAYVLKLFTKSSHYLSVELWDGSRQVSKTDRPAEP